MKKGHLHNLPPVLLRRARELRHERIPAETKLWQRLGNRQLGGFKFRRHQPTPPFIADFYCAEIGLIVELDGASHESRAAYDSSRTTRLQRDGHHVIRFLNVDVFDHFDAVLEAILEECLQLRRFPSAKPDGSPSP